MKLFAFHEQVTLPRSSAAQFGGRQIAALQQQLEVGLFAGGSSLAVRLVDFALGPDAETECSDGSGLARIRVS